MKRVQISEFLGLDKNALLLDVRSPGEYRHAHIPGAISLPLFTDEERKVVGTAYKQQSREAAIKIGLDYFGPKMRRMVEEVEALAGSKAAGQDAADGQPRRANAVYLYCWRGGMRSGAVGWLLNLYGFSVTVLAGGYKAFRNHVLKSFEQPYTFKILGGYTGSGKTELLQHLKAAGEKVIDLEGLAVHKGSAFGNINMPPQPTQEMFENLLCCELRAISGELKNGGGPVAGDRKAKDGEEGGLTSDHESQTPSTAIWLEDESQRIGAANIPVAIWRTMRDSPVYFLDIPFDERLAHITNEYGPCDREALASAIERIKKRLGPLQTKTALQLLAEGNLKECFRILLLHYDKQYRTGLTNRQNLSLLTTVSCRAITPSNAAAVLEAQHNT